ncbi:MAG: hypothetical protein AVDCRST_MAG71-1277 [uncultured Lysobacter sp.]|uniref:Uncharacterized protein n=1 Tax=uncultured Lysobacter sp. TaxID=271060 RepID=A0A6J4L319_9GAMM|nr:MAG: hypothetical protein AVDCRST_MAG71-1277 [uncultured Lysobacter sp.]
MRVVEERPALGQRHRTWRYGKSGRSAIGAGRVGRAMTAAPALRLLDSRLCGSAVTRQRNRPRYVRCHHGSPYRSRGSAVTRRHNRLRCAHCHRRPRYRRQQKTRLPAQPG